MNILMILALIPLAFVLWWFGFKATERMRIDKNEERAVKAKQLGIDLTANTQHEENSKKDI
ncbi:MAG: hypothetical protein Q9M19_08365 [Mariprofundaceae bacterium]|nr:hypothetical protein [Mariprofundaceae bacterium]